MREASAVHHLFVCPRWLHKELPLIKVDPIPFRSGANIQMGMSSSRSMEGYMATFP